LLAIETLSKGYVFRGQGHIGSRYDVAEEFLTPTAAYSYCVGIARKLAAGEISANRPEVKKRVGEYQLLASAAFQIESRKWEPILKIKSKRLANKGAIQDLLEGQSPLQHNPCPSAARATEYALEHGEKLALKLIPGLKV
jgi:hypothetical protein